CATLAMRGKREARRAIDPAATFAMALSRCDRAVELDPDFLFPRASTIVVHLFDAERLSAAGLSPVPAVERGMIAIAAAQMKVPGWRWPHYFRAALLRAGAEYTLAKGDVLAPVLARAEPSLSQLAAFQDSFPEGDAALGEITEVKAEALFAQSAAAAKP